MAVDSWGNLHKSMPQRSWTCGHCNLAVGGNVGYYFVDTKHPNKIYPCPHCDRPTFFEGSTQVPGVAFGNDVGSLPPDIAALYREARNCMAVNAHTAAVLACRKMLMNVAVARGAPGNKHFIEYVQYLAETGYVPPNGKEWVDHIRNKGNEATHEIHLMDRKTAEDLITFVEMLLKFAFEFPSRVPTTSP